jgi:hypothetical protein
MKYIITESRLDNIIFKYLDMKLNGLEKRKGRYTDFIFVLPDEEYGILGWDKTGDLYVGLILIDDIQDMFGIERYDFFRIIERYVVDRYNLDVKNTKLQKYYLR